MYIRSRYWFVCFPWLFFLSFSFDFSSLWLFFSSSFVGFLGFYGQFPIKMDAILFTFKLLMPFFSTKTNSFFEFSIFQRFRQSPWRASHLLMMREKNKESRTKIGVNGDDSIRKIRQIKSRGFSRIQRIPSPLSPPPPQKHIKRRWVPGRRVGTEIRQTPFFAPFQEKGKKKVCKTAKKQRE